MQIPVPIIFSGNSTRNSDISNQERLFRLPISDTAHDTKERAAFHTKKLDSALQRDEIELLYIEKKSSVEGFTQSLSCLSCST